MRSIPFNPTVSIFQPFARRRSSVTREGSLLKETPDVSPILISKSPLGFGTLTFWAGAIPTDRSVTKIARKKLRMLYLLIFFRPRTVKGTIIFFFGNFKYTRAL